MFQHQHNRRNHPQSALGSETTPQDSKLMLRHIDSVRMVQPGATTSRISPKTHGNLESGSTEQQRGLLDNGSVQPGPPKPTPPPPREEKRKRYQIRGINGDRSAT